MTRCLSLRLPRRDLLVWLGRAAGVGCLPLPLSGCRGCSEKEHAPVARTFDPREWRIVDAACGRLIPSDDLPGAREANVVGYIDRQLALPHFAVFRREFEAGTAALDLVAAAQLGARFLEITEAEQDRVLLAIQDGEGSTADFSAPHFFEVLLTLTLEGFLGDPSHGGNRGEVGWQVIGYTPRPPRAHGSGAAS